MMNKLIGIILSCWLFTTSSLYSQDRFDAIETSLKKLEATVPGLTETVDFSVSEASLQEFLRGLATAHNLNVSIDPSISVFVVNNFSNAKVADVLLFLCKQYNLDIRFIGSIMSFVKHIPPVEPVAVKPKKKIKIDYADQTDFLSLDLKKDTLSEVVKELTIQSFKNVVIAPGLENELVSVYIQNRPFADALDKLAFANNLVVRSTEDNFFLIEKKVAEPTAQNTTSRGSGNKTSGSNASGAKNPSFDLKITDGLITINAMDIPITNIIKDISEELLTNYFLFSEPKGNTTLYMENATYEDFLTYLLNGSDYTYKVENKVYLIGERSLERLRTTEMVQLQNRTVESIIDFIPSEIKKGVDIKEFLELNSLVLSGSYPQIHEIKKFIKDVDLVVPVVMIDVMIVDVSKSRAIKTGIKMGVGTAPAENQGTGSILPNYNFTFSTNAINEVLSLFNGYGLVNLGKVTPNFYMSIDALESEGIVKKRSTPKLSTLNGHEASLTIGETQYYAVTQSNFIGTQNPTLTNAVTYKPNTADRKVTIKPIVSGDDQVTLTISVEQSDFSGESEPGAPRGTVKVAFESMIRVKNQEMIMLGGLENKLTSNTTSGVPLLARIPILKWFFSSKAYSKEDDTMHIFIKPTIIY